MRAINPRERNKLRYPGKARTRRKGFKNSLKVRARGGGKGYKNSRGKGREGYINPKKGKGYINSREREGVYKP